MTDLIYYNGRGMFQNSLFSMESRCVFNEKPEESAEVQKEKPGFDMKFINEAGQEEEKTVENFSTGAVDQIDDIFGDLLDSKMIFEEDDDVEVYFKAKHDDFQKKVTDKLVGVADIKEEKKITKSELSSLRVSLKEKGYKLSMEDSAVINKITATAFNIHDEYKKAVNVKFNRNCTLLNENVKGRVDSLQNQLTNTCNDLISQFPVLSTHPQFQSELNFSDPSNELLQLGADLLDESRHFQTDISDIIDNNSVKAKTLYNQGVENRSETLKHFDKTQITYKQKNGIIRDVTSELVSDKKDSITKKIKLFEQESLQKLGQLSNIKKYVKDWGKWENLERIGDSRTDEENKEYDKLVSEIGLPVGTNLPYGFPSNLIEASSGHAISEGKDINYTQGVKDIDEVNQNIEDGDDKKKVSPLNAERANIAQGKMADGSDIPGDVFHFSGYVKSKKEELDKMKKQYLEKHKTGLITKEFLDKINKEINGIISLLKRKNSESLKMEKIEKKLTSESVYKHIDPKLILQYDAGYQALDVDGKKDMEGRLTDSDKQGIYNSLPQGVKKTLMDECKKGLKERYEAERKEGIRDINVQTIDFKSKMEPYNKDIKNNEDKELGPIDESKKWRFVSLNSIWMMMKDYYQLFVNKFEQIDKDNAAFLEQLVGGTLKNIKGIPYMQEIMQRGEMEGVSKMNQVRNEIVNGFKEGFKEYDNDGLMKKVEELLLENKLEPAVLQALLEAMSEKGLIYWEDLRIFKLAALVCKTEGYPIKISHDCKELYENNDIEGKLDQQLMNSKYEVMFTKLFQNSNWFQTNVDANSQGFIKEAELKGKNAAEESRVGTCQEKMRNILDNQIERMQQKGALNEYGQVRSGYAGSFDSASDDAHYYYGNMITIIEGAILPEEEQLFSIIRGIATGVLPISIITEMDTKGLCGKSPLWEYLRMVSFDDVLEIDKKITGGVKLTVDNKDNFINCNAGKLDGVFDNVTSYIFNDLMYNKKIQIRTEKLVDKWNDIDNDIQQTTFLRHNASAISTLSGSYSGRDPVKETGIKNGYMGFSTRLKKFQLNDWNNPKGDDRDNLEALKQNLASFIMFDGCVLDRCGKGTGFKRPNIDTKGPPSMDLKTNKTKMKDYIYPVRHLIEEVLLGAGESPEDVKLLFSNDYYKNSDGEDDKSKKEKQKQKIEYMATIKLGQILAQGGKGEKVLLKKIQEQQGNFNGQNYNAGLSNPNAYQFQQVA